MTKHFRFHGKDVWNIPIGEEEEILVEYKGISVPIRIVNVSRKDYGYSSYNVFLGKRYIGKLQGAVDPSQIPKKISKALNMLRYGSPKIKDPYTLMEIILEECFDEEERENAKLIMEASLIAKNLRAK